VRSLIDDDALSGYVGRSAGEALDDRGLALLVEESDGAVDRGDRFDEDVFARLPAVGRDAERCGEFGEFVGKPLVVDVDADAREDGAVVELRQDTGALALLEQPRRGAELR
jgi:hypothetical protein